MNDASEPLSYTQESLWLIENMSRQDEPVYNEPLAFRIAGQLDVGALDRALAQTVARHEALRTSFVGTADGIRAVVKDEVPDFVETVDLRQLPDKEQARLQAQQLLDGAYARPFDLAEGRLIRALIVLVDDAETLLGLTVHHIAADGWGLGLVLDDVRKRYIALTQDREPGTLTVAPAPRFSDYVHRLRDRYEQGDFDADIAYWNGLLQNGPELLKLPTDRPRPPMQTFTGATRTVTADREKIKQLIDRCHRACGSTEFGVLLASWALLLHRYSGQDQVTVGTTVLNRSTVEELSTVGCFVNTAPLPFSFGEGSMTYRQLLADTTGSLVQMLQHQEAPYPKVVESLSVDRDPSHHPVFQTMMTLLGKRKVLRLGDGLEVRAHPVNRAASKFDLLLYVTEDGDAVEFEAEFNTDLFDPETVERMLNQYVHLLHQLADDIDVEVDRVPILPPDEKALILDRWNNTAAEYPDSTVVDTIEAQAARTPDAIAVEFRGRTLTYEELDRLGNRVAHALLAEQADDTSGFVGVYMERSVDMVVALLAVMKAGLAYVPIDPEYPLERIQYMIEDSAVPLILTQDRFLADLAPVPALARTVSELTAHTADEQPVPRSLGPDSRAYMIYTSGSTGRPKGVVNRHAALFNRLTWMQSEYQLTAEDRVLQKTPFSFDVSVWEFFWPLMFGARIVVAEPGGHRDPDYLKSVISASKVTTCHFVPSMLNVFLEEEELGTYCASLRQVFCSGEALPYHTVEKFYRSLPSALHNLYGPTEAAIDVSYWPCTLDYPGNVVPIGRPIANIRLLVVDRNRRLQPIGVPGELCIAGVGLAEGYHNRPDLTEKAFVAGPFEDFAESRLYRTGDLARYLPDGQIEYLGRIDNQVKLRGFRIELGEIEAAVQALPSVREGAVIVHEHMGNRMLVAYVAADERFSTAAAKEALKRQLPEFMVPQLFVALPAVPTTVNGKLDRKALPDPMAQPAGQGTDDAGSAPAATEEERALAAAWGEVLGLATVGIDHNFFELGGDSITSIKIAVRMRDHGYHLEVKDIFAAPTIRELARGLRAVGDGAGAPAVGGTEPFATVPAEDRADLPASVVDAWPLTTLQSGMIYHSMLHEESPVYHDIFSYDIDGPLHREHLVTAVRAVVRRHAQLRSSFDLSSFGEPLQLVHAQAEPPVDFADLTQLDQEAQDAAVLRWTDEEKTRGFALEQAPLVRFRVHVRAQHRFTLSLSFHHAILDGWSVALVIEDIRKTYAGLLTGARPEPDQGAEELSYGTYVALEQAALDDPAAAAFWAGRLSGFPASLLSEGPAAGGGVPGRQESSSRTLPEPVVTRIRELAAASGVPVKSALLALHVRVLAQLLGSSDVVSGLVSNGRPEVAGGEKAAGLFLNTLPFPVSGADDDPGDVARRVFALEQEAVAYRRLPLAHILKQDGRGELFDCVFNYTDFHVYRSADDGVAITGARYFEQTNFGAVVHAHRDNFSGELGLTVNYDPGRIDHATVARYLDGFLAAAAGQGSASARGAVDPAVVAQVAEVVAKVLRLPGIEPHDNYLELGVDSISSIRIVARLKRQGIKITVQDVFEHPTAAALAAHLTSGAVPQAEVERVRPFELAGAPREEFPAHVSDAYPATSLQLEMIRHHEADVAQAVYHDVFAYQLGLPLDEALLRSALQRMVDTHDTLRTAFDLAALPEPLQLVHDTVTPSLDVFDLRQLPGEEQAAAFDHWFEGEKATGFSWDRPPLMRFFAHRTDASSFTLTLSFHHSVIDGWSLSLFVRDLVGLYAAALETGRVGDPHKPSAAYRDYVAAERESRRSSQQRDFWRKELEGVELAPLPRPVRGAGGTRWSETKLVVEPAKQDALHDLSRRTGVPLKHLMLSVHLVVLSRLQRRTDVVTGVFTGGRLEEEGAEEVLGLFLNFVPFRHDLTGATWRSLIERTFAQDRRILPYRRYPLRSIENDLGVAAGVAATFNYTQFASYGDVAREQALQHIQWFEHTHFPLLANVGHDLHQQNIVITLNADGRLLPQPWVETLGELYDAVIDRMVEAPDAPVDAASEAMTKITDLLFDDETQR
ncbi:amino acid adenylation domain-containing protein [Streptomyces sp. NPDC047117]|uniref:amino acid adenylation domain-containing protein n=1 Tax=Streptomyces sp. NPDC047117 TaxID=3155379 RepID=UPI0033C0031B